MTRRHNPACDYFMENRTRAGPRAPRFYTLRRSFVMSPTGTATLDIEDFTHWLRV